MIYHQNFKQVAVVLMLTVLAACSTTPNTTKKTGDKLAVSKPSQQKNAGSAWREAYGESQETEPNVITDNDMAVIEADVWQRIRKGFTMTPDLPLNAVTQQKLDWFVSHPEYVNKVVERARPYLHHIVSELDKRGMPMEIALLPVVESGFQPFAYSSGRASGLWQFIASTGKVYGLKQDWWYDGRRDVIASTDAALSYLQKLYNDFGDWQLALAAYNCGEGTVGRAIKRNKALGKATDFWSLDLPSETSMYVPKLIAVSHLVAQPEHYGLSLSPIQNKPFLAIVETGSQIDLTLAAELAGMTMDELSLLNPGFNHWATRPDGPHNLVVPLDKALQFEQALADIPEEKRMTWLRHKIQSGESLSVIAKRYQTTIALIKDVNELSNNVIRAGHHLLIPVASNSQLSATQQLATNKQDVKKANKHTHLVKEGDTWWDIARSYKVDVSELTNWNSKAPADMLHPGQELVIWTSKKSAGGNDKLRPVNYKIRSGDSIWTISRKFNVSVAQVREWNGLSKRTVIKPGQTLTLYVDIGQKQSS